MEDFIPAIAIVSVVIGLPWLIMHYITKWKQAPAMTGEDEKLLDEMHFMARRLEERMQTIERIVSADNPDFRPSLPPSPSVPEIDYSRRN